MDDVVQAVLRSDRYGWNRRGYLARVALASVSNRGLADRDSHLRSLSRRRRPSPAVERRSEEHQPELMTLGEGRFGEVLVHFGSGRHWMDPEPARVVVDVLGVADLIEAVDSRPRRPPRRALSPVGKASGR